MEAAVAQSAGTDKVVFIQIAVIVVQMVHFLMMPRSKPAIPTSIFVTLDDAGIGLSEIAGQGFVVGTGVMQVFNVPRQRAGFYF